MRYSITGRTMVKIVLLSVLAAFSAEMQAQSPDRLSVWYSFDDLHTDQKLHLKTITNKAGSGNDTILGTYAALKNGVVGKSLLLDGYSSYVYSADVPVIKGSFTLEGWLAMGAYPTNFSPLAEQCTDRGDGCSLGINGLGFPEFRIACRDGRVVLVSEERIPLFKWTHLAATYDGENIRLYIDGCCKKMQKMESLFVPSRKGVLRCGVSMEKTQPVGTIRERSTAYIQHFFDGLLDEVKVWNRALEAAEMDGGKQIPESQRKVDLDRRNLPYLHATGHFGAVYTRLKFYESWDNFWRVSGKPDVVVNFDQMNGHFVFWRGTSYIPHWVTENGIWYDNEFCETWGGKGCHEPMSDKRCENSQVRILESTPARCVIHWRYALVDNWYRIANTDSITGWGDWVDEIYTIYPDGTAVRSQTLHGSHIAGYDDRLSHEWHESIIVMGQGQTPESVLYPEAITVANMEGKEHSYSWAKEAPEEDTADITYIVNKKNRWMDALEGTNIQLVNTRSKNRPFVIIDPDDRPVWDIYFGEIRRDISIFPWWNHWPTAVKPSDGRYAQADDRASHSSLSHVFKWKPFRTGEDFQTRLMLNGLTKKKASELVPVTAYWCHPPKVSVALKQIENTGYDKEQMAYTLLCKDNTRSFKVRLDCSDSCKAVNPAFVVTGWNAGTFALELDGKKVKDMEGIRYGFVPTAEGINLIVWINRTFNRPVELKMEK